MRCRFEAALVVIALWAFPAAAQDAWQQHTSAGEWAFRQGDVARAEQEFRAALEVAQSLPVGSRRLEQSLYNLARLYEHDERMNEAQSTYLLLLAAQEHAFGLADPVLLDTLLAVARTSQAVGDVPQAQASLERYLALAEDADVADAGQRWRVLSSLARIESLKENHDAALGLQRPAVSALADDADAGDEERAAQLETLAQMEILYGDPEASVPLLEQAAAARRDADPGEAVAILAAGAETALGAGESELAERLASAAAAAAGDGPVPPEVDRVLAEAAWRKVRRGSDRYSELLAVGASEAELADAQARLAGWLSRLDEEPVRDEAARVEAISRLAQIAAMRGDLEAAIGWQRQLSTALRDGDPERSLLADDGLAYLLTEAGRFDEALAVNTALLARLEAAWGPDEARLLPVLERQAGLLAETGHRKEAKAMRKRIRALGE